MKIFADFHTHSIYSNTFFSGERHGKSTIEENVLSALQKELRIIGISDHGPGHFLYGLDRKKLPVIRREIDELNEKYPKIEILLGVEANLLSFDGTIDVKEEDLKYYDYLNLGFHNGVLFKKLGDYHHYFISNFLNNKFSRNHEEVIWKNTEAMIKAIENNDIKIITHPGAKIPLDIDVLAKEAKKRNTALEINNYHGHLTVEEIKIAKENGVLFSLGSDAHHEKDIGEVSEAIKRAKLAGLEPTQIINVERI